MKPKRAFTLSDIVVLLWTLLWLVGGVGYLLNIYKLLRMCCELNAWLGARALGIVIPPLVAILGFL